MFLEKDPLGTDKNKSYIKNIIPERVFDYFTRIIS